MGLVSYSDKLRGAIDDGPISRRKLSFLLAAETKNKQSSEYRALGKYLSGEETPSPERAAIIAVLLKRAELALVSPGPRRDRQAELAAEVAQLRREFDLALRGGFQRLRVLEEAVGIEAQQEEPPSSQEQRQDGGR